MDDVVEFKPIKILAQEKDGFWITGPKAGERIITLGQEYVVPGEKVVALPDERIAGKLANATNSKTGTAQ